MTFLFYSIIPTIFQKALSNSSLTFSPVLADVWKYSNPFFLAIAIAQVASTYLLRASHLLPTNITTESLRLRPLAFIALYHFPILLKLSLFSMSKTSKTTCASAQKGFLISSYQLLPLKSKKLTETFLPATVTFLTPQSTPIVVMYFCTKRPSQQRFIIQLLPVRLSPMEISYVLSKLL